MEDLMLAGEYGHVVAETIKAKAALDRRSEIVDVGTGVGFLALTLAPHVARVIAVDESEKMLSRLRSRAAEAGLNNIQTRRGDLSSLPLADGVADLVVSNVVLSRIQNPVIAIGEMARLLKPGGTLAVNGNRWHGSDRTRTIDWMKEAGVEQVGSEPIGPADSGLFTVWGIRTAHLMPNSTGCLVCGRLNPIGLKVQFWASGNRVWAAVRPGDNFQGFNGILHGGIISALMDDALWYSVHNITGEMTMTVEINVRFRKPAPVQTELVVAGELTERRGKLSEAKAFLYLPTGETAAEASGRFLTVSDNQARQLGQSW